MRYPSLSDLEPEQIRAVGEAKVQGSSSFELNGIIYSIRTNTRGYYISACDNAGHDVGQIHSGLRGQHYAIEVPPEFRGRGIGTLLLKTKEAMDGVLSHDWSARYSRILFLLRRGFMIVKKVGEFDDTDQDTSISRTERQELIGKLQTHVRERLKGDTIEDVSHTVFRLKYSPGKARKFLKQQGLE